jgi:hypothetical protein
MPRVRPTVFALTAAVFAAGSRAAGPAVFAQAKNPPAYDEAIQSARRAELLGYTAAGVGIALVIAAIPGSIYLDRRKKARNR